MQDTDYYKEIQSTLRAYDQKLWQIPSLFFVAVGFIFLNFKLENEPLRNVAVLFVGFLFLLILILLYNKAHIFHVSIQKKINEFDNKFNKNDSVLIKRMPLTSMTQKEFDERLRYLEQKEKEDEQRSDLGTKPTNERARFSKIRKWLAQTTVSFWVLWSMIVVLFLVFCLLFYSFYHWIYPQMLALL